MTFCPPPSIVVTMMRGYEKDNVVPGKVRLLVDFRVLPGMNESQTRKNETKSILKAFVCERHGLLRGKFAAAGCQNACTDDVQECAFVERRFDMRWNSPATRGGKAPVDILQPWIGVDDFIVVIGFCAGRYAAEEGGCRGNRLAAKPADEVQRQLWMGRALGHAQTAAADDGAAAGDQRAADGIAHLGLITDQRRGEVVVKERHGDVAAREGGNRLAPPRRVIGVGIGTRGEQLPEGAHKVGRAHIDPAAFVV